MQAAARKAARCMAGFKWPRQEPDYEEFDEDEDDDGDWGHEE